MICQGATPLSTIGPLEMKPLQTSLRPMTSVSNGFSKKKHKHRTVTDEQVVKSHALVGYSKTELISKHTLGLRKEKRN